MNPEELIVNRFLEQMKKSDLKHEPDGNIPPDFLMDAEYAIEVRRLNQNYFQRNNYQDLNELSIPLEEAVNDVLTSFDSKYSGQTYWVGYSYGRPISKISSIRKELRKQLFEIINNPIQNSVKMRILEELEIHVWPAKSIKGKTFRNAAILDDDWGGPEVYTYFNNINLCVREKNIKIKNYKEKYPNWWLVLVDFTDLFPSSDDINEIINNVDDLGLFNKLIIIDRFTSEAKFKIYKKTKNG